MPTVINLDIGPQFLFGHTKPFLPVHDDVIIYDNDCQEVRLSFQVPRLLFRRFIALIGFAANDFVLTLIHAFRDNPYGQEARGAPSSGWGFRPRSGMYLLSVYSIFKVREGVCFVPQ